MATEKKVRVAIVGLGFGAEFIPIYQAHPNAEMYAICRRNKAELDRVRRPVRRSRKRYTDYDELLKDPNVDAVHINSPIPDHAPQTIAALKAGKHVACTVPMATTQGRDQGDRRAAAEDRQGLHDDGDGRLQPRVPVRQGPVRPRRARPHPVPPRQPPAGHGRLAGYWPGLPPMWYATHCVSPCLAILSRPGEGQVALAESVVCHGSGRIREELITKYNSPFAIETATFKIKGSDVVAEVTRSLFDTARQYRESFDVTGSRTSASSGSRWRARSRCCTCAGLPEPQIPRRVKVPDFAGRLPEPIRKFTGAIHDATHLSFLQGGGPRRQPPAPGAQLPDGGARQAAGVPGRADQRQLDAGRHLRRRVRDEGRRPGGDSDVLMKMKSRERERPEDCWLKPNGEKPRVCRWL